MGLCWTKLCSHIKAVAIHSLCLFFPAHVCCSDHSLKSQGCPGLQPGPGPCSGCREQGHITAGSKPSSCCFSPQPLLLAEPAACPDTLAPLQRPTGGGCPGPGLMQGEGHQWGSLGLHPQAVPAQASQGRSPDLHRAGGTGVPEASMTMQQGCWHTACTALHGAAASLRGSGQSHTRAALSPTALGPQTSTQGCCSAPLPAAPRTLSPHWAHGQGAAPTQLFLSADPNNCNCLPGLHA